MGVFWIDHALPFHCSANAVSKLPFPNDPMAVQAIADVHDTPSSELAALLDLGLEDDIPLPHALGPPEVRAILSDSDDPVAAVARALSALVIAGKIRIYRGHWDDPDPPRVSPEEAVQLLQTARGSASTSTIPTSSDSGSSTSRTSVPSTGDRGPAAGLQPIPAALPRVPVCATGSSAP